MIYVSKGFTEAQNKAIQTRESDILVSAGAGSGKTGVLVERVVQLLTAGSNAVDTDKILVITFTEKATREMKFRITQALDKAGRAEIRRKIETAYISTIHGFCSRLLKENPFDAGVDPDYRVLDTHQSGQLLRLSCDQAVNYAQLRQDQEILLLMNEVQSLQDGRDPLPMLLSSVVTIFHRCRGAGRTRDQLETLMQGEEVTGADSQLSLRRILEPITEELKLCGEELETLERKVSTAWALISRQLSEKLELLLVPDISPKAVLQELRFLGDHMKSIRLGSKAVLGEEIQVLSGIERVKALCESLRGLFAALDKEQSGEKEANHTHSQKMSCAFWKLMGSVWDFYEEEKRRRSALDHDDLQARAVQMLEHCEGVRRQYQNQFDHLLIDEFQDTNPLQMQLLTLLRRDKPENTISARNELFIVGDVQQSIYAFRNADPTLFQGLERQYREQKQGVHLTLQENFRSRPEILETVDRVFSQIWRRSETHFTPLSAGAAFDVKQSPSLEILAVENYRRPDFKRIEPQALAQRLKQMVQNEEVHLTHQADKRRGESVQYGDVALLFRALTDLPRYEQAFSQEGIPYYVVGGGRGYYARYEIRDLLNVLMLLDAPSRNVTTAAVLRSPFVGLSTDALYRISNCAQEQGKLSKAPICLFATLQEEGIKSLLSEEERASLKRFLQALEKLVHEDRSPVGQLLEKLISLTQYDAKLLVRPGGRRRLANVRKLLQMANSERVEDIPQFIQRLKDLHRIADREGDAPTEEEEANVVKIYTIHGAKGLEFPVVVLPDLSRQAPPRGDALFVCDPSGPSLGHRLNGSPDLTYEAVQQREIEQEREEMARMLYVAMTRAREHLILSGNIGAVKSHVNWMNDIAQTLGVIGLPQKPETRTLLGGVKAAVAPLTYYLSGEENPDLDLDAQKREAKRAENVFDRLGKRKADKV